MPVTQWSGSVVRFANAPDCSLPDDAPARSAHLSVPSDVTGLSRPIQYFLPATISVGGTVTLFHVPATGASLRPEVRSVVGCPPSSEYRPNSMAVEFESH